MVIAQVMTDTSPEFESRRVRELEQLLSREIEVRHRAEEALRHCDARYHFIAKNLTEMVLAYDMDRHLTFANAAAQTLTGYSAADLKQQHFISWVHPEDRPRMMSCWDRLFQGQSFQEEEYRLVTRDGRVKWMAASWGPLMDDNGRQVGVQGREREVTERRMAEATLRVREERYRTLFEDSPFPMWEEDFSLVKEFLDDLKARGVGDICGYLTQHRDQAEACVGRIRILDVNHAARLFYGAESKEELMRGLKPIVDDTGWHVICEEMGRLAAGDSMYRAEFETRTMRGETRVVSMIVSIEPSPGDWSRVIVSFFDITDRKRLEEQFLQSQKLESLGRLAGGIAHDFNNLLMVITGYSELLLGDPEVGPRTLAGLREIKSAGERGAELTEQLLAFSRKRLGQPRPLSLNAVIRESQSMLERVLGEDVRLVVALDPEAPTIRADRGQMHQVLMNLVVNAREAMPQGGELHIETAHSVEDGSSFVRVRVADTGVGMDERTRQHVFEPFFTTKSTAKGTGLGLATVFGVITQAGGRITVSSEPGDGSEFTIFLPGIPTPAKTEPAAETTAPASSGWGTVLVVEDQEDVRRLTVLILKSLGYDVLEAADANEAMAVSEGFRGTIRLMLTDVIMPGMNGRQLAERMAVLRPEMKVVFMSGYTDRIMSPNGVLDSSVAYLQKPFSSEQLSAKVRQVLDGGPTR
ncbi:MAG: sensor hybrid histidine kinase [Candidatus Solibacter sp.]|nr:sensor hybrid histidine kinase [Candidatus Solibacter sp.]